MTFESDDVLPQAVERFKATKHLYIENQKGRTFKTQNDFGPLKSKTVFPIIADFDTAEDFGHYAHPIQIPPYRAPEVLLGWGWTEKVDIWNFGNVVRL